MDLVFANRMSDNTTIHISEAKNGRSCECVCPVCGKSVIARQGKKNKWSFAHESFSNCSSETALHLYAKALIEKEKRLYLPGVTIINRPLDCFSQNLIDDVKKSGAFRPDFVICSWGGKEIIPDRLVLEKKLEDNDIVPDIIAYVNNKPIAIEIYVTHRVDENKKKKFHQLKLSAIEIDLSNVDIENIDKQELDKIILGKTERKYWIYNERMTQHTENDQLFKIFEDKSRTWALACHTFFFVEKKPSVLVNSYKEWFRNNAPVCQACGCVMKLQQDKHRRSFLWRCSNKTCNSVASIRKCLPSCPHCNDGYIMPIYSEKLKRRFFGCSNFPKCNFSTSN